MRTQRLRFTTLAAWLFLSMTAAAGALCAATELDAMMARLPGGWSGDGNETPFGPMGFAILWDRQEDGSLHSRSAFNRETYLDFRLWKDDDGRWMLTEEGGMEGLGVQQHSLAPVGPTEIDGVYRWVLEENPEFLAIDMGIDDGRMVMDVTLRGEPHVALRLDRLPDESLPELRRQLVAQAERDPASGPSLHEFMAQQAANRTPVATDDPIAAARARTETNPKDGAAWLDLAQRLGEAIDRNPGNGPRYAYEMLEALTTAIATDPTLIEAYHWLVGYYLNAPPIAGGSLAKARETAGELAKHDPTGAAQLHQQIDSEASRRAESTENSGATGGTQ